MKIKGRYRDVLSKEGKIIKDFGWKSNRIVEDYGRFLAALMRKELSGQVGIEFMAVGNYEDFDVFQKKVALYFNTRDDKETCPLKDKKNMGKWVWAKKIDANQIIYLYPDDEPANMITNKLKLNVTFEETEPSEETFGFREFALLGIYKSPEGKFDTKQMFFINYVNHDLITKDMTMKLSRTIKLTFPIEKEAEAA